MSFQSTTLLIVGAGPAGLTTALSLVKQGFRDFVIVDCSVTKPAGTRAVAIHAATLELLDTLGCAEPLVKLGVKSLRYHVSDKSGSTIFSASMSSLAPYTRFPYVLYVPQPTTEKVLETELQNLGIRILRPDRADELVVANGGEVQVSFESGMIISARYVIGADGARSVIRQGTGIAFIDPGDLSLNDLAGQMVVADVVLSSKNAHLHNSVFITVSNNGTIAFFPLPTDPGSTEIITRIAFTVPLSAGSPPTSPSASYLQQHLHKVGPTQLLSDPNLIQISRVIWSTRFRTHSAIADKFMVSMGDNGFILLVGDAAHIHSPAGGQGMNLGIRDAVGLGQVLATYLMSPPEFHEKYKKSLEDYVTTRRQKALSTIRLTKKILNILAFCSSTRIMGFIGCLLFRFLGRIPFVKRRVVWSLSGLGNS